MTRITREQFVSDFKREDSDAAIDVNHLTPATGKKLENAGITKGDLAEIAGDDGKINKDQEYIALYNKVDSFEKNNASTEYFDTTDAKNALTSSGEAYEALKSQLDFNRAKSILQGPHPAKANANPTAEGPKVNLLDDEERKGGLLPPMTAGPTKKDQKLDGPLKSEQALQAELENSQKELAKMLNNPLVQAGFKVQQTIDQLEQQKNYATPEEKKSIEIVQGQLTDLHDHLNQRSLVIVKIEHAQAKVDSNLKELDKTKEGFPEAKQIVEDIQQQLRQVNDQLNIQRLKEDPSLQQKLEKTITTVAPPLKLILP